MSEIKMLTAKKTLKLDCGCIIQAHQSFMVTRLFTCPQAMTELLRILMTPHQKSEVKHEQSKQKEA